MTEIQGLFLSITQTFVRHFLKTSYKVTLGESNPLERRKLILTRGGEMVIRKTTIKHV